MTVVEKIGKRFTTQDTMIEGLTVRKVLDGDDIVAVQVFNESGWKIAEYKSWAMFERYQLSPQAKARRAKGRS